MEVRDIIMAIGFLIIFSYQRHKIGSLEIQIASQTAILKVPKPLLSCLI
jgi:hypothetical protein